MILPMTISSIRGFRLPRGYVPSLALLATYLLTSPLPAQPAASPKPEPSRLIARLSALSADSMQGRRAGTPDAARARTWIIRELQSIGVAPLGARYESPFTIRARRATATTDTLGVNLLARIPGRKADGPVLVLSAHYDHVGVQNGLIHNGADDNASGTVALLAIAEQFKANPPEHDVILAFFDAEESGLQGARAFVANPPIPLARMALNVNLDMVARQDGGALWVAGTAHTPALAPLVEEVARTAAITVRLGHDRPTGKPGDDWTNSSDHGAFHAARIPFLYLGVEDHPDYHKPGDDADKVDPTFYAGVVDFVTRLMAPLDRALPTIRRP